MKSLQHRGFTLIETIVAISIIALMTVVGANMMVNVLRLNSEMRGLLLVQDDARRAFKVMTKEMRTASFADNGAYPIAAATADGITFYSDVDKDGKAERIRYYRSGSTLMRGIIDPVGDPSTYDLLSETNAAIATDIFNGTTAIFDYYDSSYAGSGSPLPSPVIVQAIRLVKITLIINKNSGLAPGDHTYTTQVMLRNLKDNL